MAHDNEGNKQVVLAAGKIAEAWVEWDNLSGLVQLGHAKTDA